MHPSHQERLWLVGFLEYAGYSIADIIGIIHKQNHWEDYNREYTNYQVAVTLGSRRSGKRNGAGGAPSSQPRRAKSWFRFMIDPTKFINHCSMGCEKCHDLKCIDGLKVLNNSSS